MRTFYIVPIRRRPRWKRVLLYPRTVWRAYRLARRQGDGPYQALHIALLLSRVQLLKG